MWFRKKRIPLSEMDPQILSVGLLILLRGALLARLLVIKYRARKALREIA